VNQDQKTVVFLYRRLPEYVYRCLEHFTRNYPYRAVIIRYDDDPDTRYQFPDDSAIELVYKKDVDVVAFVNKLGPSMIIVSSWRDKTYKNIALQYRKLIPVAIGIDNPYTGAFRQKLLSILSPIYIRRYFNKAWVAGQSQYRYARRLGFPGKDIVGNMYCADTEKFYSAREAANRSKKQNYPRTIVFVGRFVEYKQPHILVKLFHEVNAGLDNRWMLILAGEGPLKAQIAANNYPFVVLSDFISPSNLPEFYQEAGIFCLPSHGEHWGVAVHEAAAAGLPLLLSDSVEAGTLFLNDGINGYSFKSGNEDAMKLALKKVMQRTDKELREMGERSYELSKKISHAVWSASLNSLMN
jgi:glycosyltransferase involved in cell wall biosynthesis